MDLNCQGRYEGECGVDEDMVYNSEGYKELIPPVQGIKVNMKKELKSVEYFVLNFINK